MKNQIWRKIRLIWIIWLGGMVGCGPITLPTVQPQDGYQTTGNRAKTGTLSRKNLKNPQKSLKPQEATTHPHQSSSPKKLYRPASKQSSTPKRTVTKEDDDKRKDKRKKLKSMAK